MPVIADLGSGSLVDLSLTAAERADAARDDCGRRGLVSFSGDKLLGGPQAGIIVGKRELIAQLQQHPLKRPAADKMTLAALERRCGSISTRRNWPTACPRCVC
jgi:L-seryl-tRNA(Ser) seleniumtransferase